MLQGGMTTQKNSQENHYQKANTSGLTTYFFLSLSLLRVCDPPACWACDWSNSAAVFLCLNAFTSSSRDFFLSSSFFFSSWCNFFRRSNFSCSWRERREVSRVQHYQIFCSQEKRKMEGSREIWTFESPLVSTSFLAPELPVPKGQGTASFHNSQAAF